jgi:hypothetical protein
MKAATVSIIKATAPLVSQHARQITGLFYKNMFAKNPETLQFFNQANQVCLNARQYRDSQCHSIHFVNNHVVYPCLFVSSSVERWPSTTGFGECNHRLWFQH